MIIVDINVLIYSVEPQFEFHAPSRSFLDLNLASGTAIGIPWICVVGFIRIATSKTMFGNPRSIAAALDQVNHWLDHPSVSTPEPGARHVAILRALLGATGSAGNLTNDAHLAALAIERKATMVSFDRDFGRFAGLTWVNPAQTLPIKR